MIRRSPRLTLALLLGLLMLITLTAAHLGALRLSPVALLRDGDPSSGRSGSTSACRGCFWQW